MAGTRIKKYIVLHYSMTARDRTTFAAVDRYHKEKWNFKSSLGHYIGYHYFIDGKGVITQGRADEESGAHCKEQGKNFDSIGICLAGNFDTETPSAKQLASLKTLIIGLMKKHKIPFANLKFHRDYAKYKSCPGNNIKPDFYKVLLAVPANKVK